MKLLNKLEYKYGKYAIKGLMKYICVLTVSAYLINLIMPGFMNYLYLTKGLLLQGQIWRLITFIIIPPNSSVIFILLAIYFYYFVGSSLEKEWGSFKFNAYYFIGVILNIFAVLITGGVANIYLLNLSLFFAFAYLYPNQEIRLYLLIPIKVKYLGMINGVFFLYTFITGDLAVKIIVLASIANFLLFFGKEIYHEILFKGKVKTKKAIYKNKTKVIKAAFHKCTICGKTELDDPKMTFRYCSKCNGDYEYCEDHIKDHIHKT